MDDRPDIDWSKFTWPVNNTCTCANCDVPFRSHAKWHNGMWSKDPCPACGGYSLKKVEGDPETMSVPTVRADKEGE